MGMGSLAFFSGLGTGYLTQTEKERDRAMAEKKDARDQAVADREAKTFADQQAQQQGFKDAVAPVTMQEGAGGYLKPDSADNRDVGQPDGPTIDNGQLSSMAYRVGTGPATQNFANRPDAMLAQSTANSPQAQNQRIQAAANASGNPMAALALQKGQLQASGLMREEETAVINHQLSQVMRENGGDAFRTAAVIGTKAGGPMAGMTVEPVVSADKSSVTLTGTKPDGSTVQFKTFPNNDIGQRQALTSLTQMDPMLMIKTLKDIHDDRLKDTKEAREGTKETREGRLADSTIELQKHQGNYYEKHGIYMDKSGDALGVKADAAMMKAENAPSGFDRMPKDIQMQYQGHLKEAEKARDDARKHETVNSGNMTPEVNATIRKFELQAKTAERKAGTLMDSYRGTGGATTSDDRLGVRNFPSDGFTQAEKDEQEGSIALREAGANPQAALEKLQKAADAAKGEQKSIILQQVKSLQKGIDAAKAKPATPANSAPAIATQQGVSREMKPSALSNKVLDFFTGTGNPPPSMSAQEATLPVAPRTPATPADGIGQLPDQARAALKTLASGPRPGLEKGRAAMDAYDAQLAAARQRVTELQAQYQNALPKQAPAFVAPR